MYNSIPTMVDENGLKRFKLFDGNLTKSFHSVGNFNWTIGSYPIYDDCNNIVEYMDLLGNFTKKPTEFAYELYKYVITGRNSSIIFSGYTTLIDFPYQYFADKKVIEFVKNEELNKYRNLCINGCFNSIFSKLQYKIYVKRCLKIKLYQAEHCVKGAQANMNVDSFNI